MNQSLPALLGAAFAFTLTAPAQIPVLTRSDVVFMYQASPEIYADYGATLLAWGGGSTSGARATEIKTFGSVGMVTEFSRYYERFPETYQQGLCRDLKGEPYKVPWLTDHQHKGVPYWWCCTRQPVFRQYISERVAQTVKSGVFGVHIDDHLGTAGSIGSGGCFCNRCVEEFRAELAHDTPPGIANPAQYDYAETLRTWLAEKPGRSVQAHPLWPRWRSYQLRGAAAFMQELRQLAAKTAGHPVPMSANACLLWGPHLNDYQALDFFSAEIDHHASTKHFSDAPLVAYRIADAVNRPLASTASGGDWAFIKENNLSGLVQGWIALGYAAGHSIMAPNRQWCYTKEKGTHWYAGPKEKFAFLYRFVHDNPALFDGYENYPDIVVAYAQRTFDRDSGKLMTACRRLSEAYLSYRLLLGGDNVVLHPLPREQLKTAQRLLVLEPGDFQAADQQALEAVDRAKRIESLEKALQTITPAVSAGARTSVRVSPRVKPGSAVVHVLNWDYDAATDTVKQQKEVRLTVQLTELGVPNATHAMAHSPGGKPLSLPIEAGIITLPELGLWTILEFH